MRASTTPSAGSPAEDWKDVTPACVPGPNSRLAAAAQHVSLNKLVPGALTVIRWTKIGGTIVLCALATVVTASGATWRATRRRAVEAAGIRE
ncbi:hypothetical protein [Kitasatospora aureofaciens]|uniref:hypothetical protein n=1 Tax=Kitasatospora aureofaciens TaxID=1894 RepID=UPI0036F46802